MRIGTAAGPSEVGKIVSVLVLAELVASFEGSMIYAALAQFYRMFRDPVSVGWVVTGYMLVAVSAAAIGARLGDIYGRKLVLMICLGVACLGSLISAASDQLIWIILGRSVQGFAGAILPLCYGMLREYLPRASLPLSIGCLSATLSAGGGLGLVMGGLLMDHGSWHSIFLASAALAGLSALAVLQVIPESRDKSPGDVDWVGGVLFVPGLSLVLYALGLGEKQGWGSAGQAAPMVAGLAIILGWLVYERRVANPLINVALLFDRSIGLSVSIIMLLGLGTMNLPQVVMVMLQQPVASGAGFGLAAGKAGALAFPGAMLGVVASPLCGWFAARRGSRGAMIAATLAALSAWIGLALFRDSVMLVAGWMWLNNFALGAAVAASANLIVEAAPPARTSEATGLAQIARKLAMATGAQGIAILLSASSGKVVGGGAFPDHAAYQLTYWTVAGLCALAVVASLCLPVWQDRRAQAIEPKP